MSERQSAENDTPLPDLYVLEPVDRCAESVGLQCGYPAADHPLNVSGYFHEFKAGRKEFCRLSEQEVRHFLPPECRWCPPGCRSCEPDDCECYRHQDWSDKASDPDWPYVIPPA